MASRIAVGKDSEVLAERISSIEAKGQENGSTASRINISGRALLLSRLFNNNNEQAEIPVETNTTDSAVTGSKSIVHWLTNEDRATLEKAYEYADSNGVDLRYVDDLASDMAMYRYSKSVTQGDIYNLEGRKLTFDFTDSDKKIADRISNSEAVNETRIDRGFISWILDSSKPNHAVRFDFLEYIVHKLPASDAAVDNHSDKNFRFYKGGPNAIVTNVSDEVNTYYISFKPEYVSVNGVGRWVKDGENGDEKNKTIANELTKQKNSQAMLLLKYLIGE